MKRILIVDDAFFIRVVLKEVLSPEGYELLEANDGKEGVELYEREKPDLVLLDILMPVMDGIAAFKEMKKINPDAKIIFISAVEEKEALNKLSEYNIDGFIKKPFDIDNIKAQVNIVLRT